MQEDEVLGKAYDSRLMKRLLQYARPYSSYVVGAILLTIFISALSPLRPYLTKLAIDDYIALGDEDGLLLIALLLLGTLLLQGFAQYFMMYFTQWIGQRIIVDVRMQIFTRMQKLALRFFDRNPVGRLVTRVTNDVEVLNEMFSSGLVTVFADIFILLWIVIFMLSINWQLALVTFSVLPALVYGTFLFRRKVRETYRDVRLQLARLNSFTQERVSGMMTVQLFGREKKETDAFAGINRKHRDANIRSVFYYALFYPSVDFISSLAVALIIWYAGGEILAGILTVGTMISFIQYTEMFFRPIRDLSEKYNVMQTAMASSERIFKLLDDQTIIPDPPGERARPLPSVETIRFENVSFAYNEADWVLRDVSFEIPKGQTVAIVGATGSGKTTIINLLCRFYDIQKGHITIGGTDLRDIPTTELRKHIGIVLQDVFLFSGSIHNNITLGDSSISREHVEKVSQLVGVDRFIERLPERYDSRIRERGGSLSVGQKQLLAFARALAYDPQLLVLDEATSSVDTESEMLIQEAITKMLKGRTSVVIAHRLSTIQNADTILVMHKGQIREQGNHQELLAMRGIYYRLYQLQYKDQDLSSVA
ncbi:MAG: antibiotic ABC transporter ATP-binding protein [Ignavibacteria bacterium]|nr:MAG: antibiotic ABC transporter ATP-binding protein [Ignavibacteria bacterium]